LLNREVLGSRRVGLGRLQLTPLLGSEIYNIFGKNANREIFII
jgi:hypothetical protein